MKRGATLVALLGMVAVTGCGAGTHNPRDAQDAAVASGDDAAVELDDAGQPIGQITATVIAPGTPADAASHFTGAADPSLAPMVVYPANGLLIPPNLDELEIQIQPAGSATDLYEIAFESATVDVHIYTVCNAAGTGCALTPDEATWKAISDAARNGTVTMTVSAASSMGGGVGSAAPQTISFADEDMLGGIYYWAASSGGIYRYDFGRRGQSAEAFYIPGSQPGQAGVVECVGCHALSRNGARMAAGLNAPTPAPTMRLIDVATRKTLFDQGTMLSGGSNFEALTPDGSQVISTETGGLTIHDAATGATIGSTLANADMPDVSPDAKTVVFARATGGCPLGLCVTLELEGASLFTTPYTGMGFGGVKPLVSGGGNNYYPSFSPDGQYVVFNRSSGSSYDAPDATVWVVSANGGTPINLASANAVPVGAGNSWPKWAPFIHHFGGSTIMWVSYSSRRPYGLRNLGDLSACTQMDTTGCPNAQIWVVPVDTAKLAAGVDSGYPAFWLPFQDPTTGNHIPQWVETVARQPCTPGGVDNAGCDSGETCDNGQCVPMVM